VGSSRVASDAVPEETRALASRHLITGLANGAHSRLLRDCCWFALDRPSLLRWCVIAFSPAPGCRVSPRELRGALRSGQGHDLLGWTITTIVSGIGDGVHLQFAPSPSTGDGWLATGTIQGPFLRDSGSHGHQVGSVAVWAKTNQISSEAFRTLDAMANTKRHGTGQPG